MCVQYVCPECGGHYESRRLVRIRHYDGDEFQWWPNYCGLCDGGYVTLDLIVERTDDPLEYIARLLAPQAAMSAESPADAADIPF